MKRTATRILLPSLLSVGLLISGCDTAGVDESEPPELIAPTAFEVETFQQSATKSAAGDNLTAAGLRYIPVSVTLGVQYLLIPKIVTDLATTGEPRLVEGQWVWEVDQETQQGSFSIELTGRPDGEQVDWTMRLSANNPYTGQIENFVLYTARTSEDGSQGTWDLYYKIAGESVNVLTAEFEVESPVEKRISFSVPETAPAYVGYEVSYQRDGNERVFFWNQPDTGDEHTLTWNPETGLGSIQSTSYKDGLRYCWDAQGNDTACV